MPIWWITFAYMLIVSGIGMAFYNNRIKNTANLGPVDDSNKYEEKTIGLFFALATFALLVYFVGQRSYIFDTYDYQYAYTNYYTTELSQITGIWNGTIPGKGKLYMTILVLFKHFSGGADYNAWFTFIAIIECTSIALFLYKYSINNTLSIYLFFTSGCFLWLVNGFRQFLAVSFVLFFVDWIKQRKTIPFFIVIILAYFVHSSAILWIPVYFLIYLKPWTKKFILLSLLFTVALLFISTSSLLDDTDYSYLNTGEFSNGVNPIRVLVMAVPAIIAFVKRKDIEKKTSSFINIWINISVIITECYIVGMFTNGIVGRIGIYFQFFNYLLLPWLLKNAFDEYMSKIITTACIVGFALYFCYDMFIAGNGIYQSINLNLHYL